MRVFERDGYSPEYSTLVLRDPAGYEPAGPDPEDAEPAGTFAGAGTGWLTARTGGGSDVVRLEGLDGPPPADAAAFDEVLETPYRAISGGLSLTVMTGGVGGGADLELGGGGWYRVRVARRAGAGDSGRWLLRFWPDRAPESPVWLVRGRPAVGAGNDGWTTELPGPAMDVARIVRAAIIASGRAVTVDDVDEWTRTHRHPSDWLDAPLWRPPREPGTTGHADLDRMHAARHAKAMAWQAGMRRRLDEIAAELGVPPVRGKHDVLPLLVAAGLLVRDDTGRYRTGRPGRVDTVLSLPPKRVQAVRMSDARSRYRALAEDVAAVLRWVPRAVLETTAAELAGRLLVTEAQARDVLGFAEQTGMLHADGEQQHLLLRPGLRPSPPPPAADTPPVAEAAETEAEPAGEPHQPRKPQRRTAYPLFGAPPRAGAVTADGIVVVWRDGVRVELAHLGTAPWRRALQTAHGVLVLPDDRFPRLVTETGEVRIFDRQFPGDLALLGDGRRLAVVDGAHRLRLVDLTGALPDTRPWPEDRPVILHGAHRDTVYLTDLPGRTTLRWTPGSEPEPCGHPVREIDPHSGTCTWTTDEGVVVARPDQPAVTVPVDHRACLAPGGDRLWMMRSRPPALTLFPVEPGPELRPRVLGWPDENPQQTYQQLIWEDTEQVLLTYRASHARGEPASGVRLSIRDGTVERLPDAGTHRQALILTEPWVSAGQE